MEELRQHVRGRARPGGYARPEKGDDKAGSGPTFMAQIAASNCAALIENVSCAQRGPRAPATRFISALWAR
jgi:hypothetical protein